MLLLGVQIYRRFYTEEKERRNGVLAVDVLRSCPQPYISLSRILSVSIDESDVLFITYHNFDIPPFRFILDLDHETFSCRTWVIVVFRAFLALFILREQSLTHFLHQDLLFALHFSYLIAQM